MTCDVIDWSTQKARWHVNNTICLYGQARPGGVTWPWGLIEADAMFNSFLRLENAHGPTSFDHSRHEVGP